MSARGYSLVEVVVAAAIVAIGVAAGAALINTLVMQEELNAGTVRASNLQEQAVMLYRLGFTNSQEMCNLLPEVCATSGTPGAGAFSLAFGAPVATNATATLSGGGQATVSCQTVSCTIVYGSPIVGRSQVSYLSNTVTFVRPTIRVGP
jgi:prepilin-type N-terminal cleavage/methylation domain-containing protein